jgi:chitin synthase
MDYVPLSLRVGPVGAAAELFFNDGRQPPNQAVSVPPPIPQSVGPPIFQEESSYDSPGEPEEAPRRSSGSEWTRKKLFRDNLVVDSPVPEDLLQQVPHAAPPERNEFTHVRYSAVNCSAAEFSDKKFMLRQELFLKPRHTEILIHLSLKDEGEIPFARTILGVIQNVEYMVTRAPSPWGKDSWKKIVVCLQSDGHPDRKILSLLRAMGIFFTFDFTHSIPEIETIIDTNPRVVNGHSVQVHLYEVSPASPLPWPTSNPTPQYCTQFKPVLEKHSVSTVRGLTGVQVLFCLPEMNEFRPEPTDGCTWLEAFAKRLEPSMCINIGADTNVGKDAFYAIWKSYESRDNKIKPDRNIGDIPVYNFKGNILNRWSAAIGGRFG